MKKALSLIVSAIMTAAAIMPVSTSAEEEQYIPLFYFKADETENVTVIRDNVIHIPSEALADGDLTVDVSIYIEDEIQEADSSKGIYAASAKWRCESDYITLGGLVDPSASTGVTKTYTTSEGETFTTDLTPFCYGIIQDDGSLKVKYVPQLVSLPESNSLYFTYTTSNAAANPFDALGASADEFPFAQFSAVIDSETPEGVYEIIFATPDNTAADRSVVSHGAVALAKTNFYSFYPRTKDLTIIVGDYTLGDADNDGNINALDASLVLTAYANTATGKETGLTQLQELAADADGNGRIDAIDASEILGYYAHIATGGTGTFPEYLAK
ncbi:MAG: hypothetical protein IJX77_00515 [Ruminococcus sp.]|nr:hypothetical protein [Ruminococcus sp.]